MNLDDWQVLLEEHFTQLRASRTSRVGDKPIFVLEHGLSEAKIAELRGEILAAILKTTPNTSNYLPWVVYATEVGYRYSGTEYWQTFEADTPGWTARGDRGWIRRSFEKFHKTFGGAKPSGPFAENFSIICWPIAHSILPQDLQRHFARILHEARHGFRSEFFKNPILLGETIAARSWDATSRFQNFTQEHLLVGQIAAALLQGADTETGLILPATLQRIVKDLEREGRSRDWLRGAQDVAGKVQLSGLASPASEDKLPTAPREAREAVAALGVEPRLGLIPTGAATWDVQLKVPDLSPLLLRFPQLRPILVDSRCVVLGSSGRPRPRGYFLHGAQTIRLETWPESGTILLQFEATTPELQFLLATDCLLKAGPTWLFRIGSDGLAYEIKGKVVRPGQSYIVLTLEKCDILEGTPVTTSCRGINAVRLDIPTAISIELEKTLRALGLVQARHFELWPAGLPPAKWDGEGSAEWLVSDQPCIGVRADHSVSAFTLDLKGPLSQRLEVAPTAPGEPIFISLPQLPLGRYELEATVVSSGRGNQETGLLDFMIREPRTWEPASGHQGPLLAFIDPTNPTLEQLCEGSVGIDIHGPARRNLACTMSLSTRTDTKTLLQKNFSLQLPVTTSSWRSQFSKVVLDSKEFSDAYDRAQSCQILFDGGELGRISLQCEREFSPLRWLVRREGKFWALILIDNTGADKAASVKRYDFSSPDTPVAVADISKEGRLAVNPEGGLYVAEIGDYRCAVVMPPFGKTLTGLTGLRGVIPNFKTVARLSGEIDRLLDLYILWDEAHLPGNILAAIRRGNVLTAIVQKIFSVIGGQPWNQAELNMDGTADALTKLAPAISIKYDEQRGIAPALLKTFAAMAARSPASRADALWPILSPYIRFSLPLPQNGSANHARWICEFALRLASSPRSVRKWAGSDYDVTLNKVFESPTLARAARFLVIAINSHLGPPPIAARNLYSGWDWA